MDIEECFLWPFIIFSKKNVEIQSCEWCVLMHIVAG